MLNEKEIVLFEQKHLSQFKTLSELMVAKKELEKQEKSVKEELEAAFKEYGIKSLKNEYINISYVEESVTKSIDLEAFQDAEPVAFAELLTDYPKFNKRKGYIRFSLPKK